MFHLVLLFLLGAAVGGVLNLVIERLRWNLGSSSPWFPDPQRSTPARWHDRLPLVGWVSWQHQVTLYGRRFWIRPLLIELLTGALFAGLYEWEVTRAALLGPIANWRGVPPGVWPCPWGTQVALLLSYQSHVILISLMIAATFIDIDDRIIPDSITIPGTLAGLVLAALTPWSLLPNELMVIGAAPPIVDFLKCTSPDPWPAKLDGSPNTFSLWLGLACYAGWCLALLPRHWRTRHGLKRAFQILFARVTREPISLLVLLLAIGGSLLILTAWWTGGAHWTGLLTALVGVAGGGGLVWAVRIIGTVVLGREAMGFGDVTLLAMIGAFLGWQTCVIIFFLAPLVALLIGVANWLLHSDHEIPYGPFLCLAALATILFWSDLWQWAGQRFFAPIWLMPLVLVFCLGLMALLLGGMRLLGGLFHRRGD